MKTIWKYPLRVEQYQEVLLPENAKILTVQVQNGVPCLWAEVETQIRQTISHRLSMVATGEEIKFKLYRYLGTFQLNAGKFVLHLYEVFDTEE